MREEGKDEEIEAAKAKQDEGANKPIGDSVSVSSKIVNEEDIDEEEEDEEIEAASQDEDELDEEDGEDELEEEDGEDEDVEMELVVNDEDEAHSGSDGSNKQGPILKNPPGENPKEEVEEEIEEKSETQIVNNQLNILDFSSISPRQQ